MAAFATVILVLFSALAAVGEKQVDYLFVLCIFLALLAGFLLLLKGTFPKAISIILMVLLPFGALCCMEFYTHVPWDLTPPIAILNYLFYLILFLIGFAVFGNAAGGSILMAGFPMLVGLVNYFVVSFRSSPIVPWDLYSLRTAASVAGNYEITFNYRIVLVMIGFVYLMVIGSKLKLRFPSRRLLPRLAGVAAAAVLMVGYITAVKTDEVGDLVGLDTTLFTPNVLYRNNGFMAAFLSNLKFMDVEKPEGYSPEAAQEIASSGSGAGEGGEASADSGSGTKPNIIVIMNEAFSDLSVYGDLNVSEDYMPFIHSLQENTIKGDLYVSVKGGNTANTEFEFLTGNSMAFLPAGSVPYQQYIKGEMPSMASHLASLGYETHALHPYNASGWNRDQVYPWLGFEQSHFRDDFEEVSLLRGYVDDHSAFQKLIELYEEKEEGTPLFAFEVTMQNHGGYSKEYTDLFPDIKLLDYEGNETTSVQAAEKYLTLIQKSDAAFQELVTYFQNQDEPTIILMFGDHQPSDYICNPILRLFGKDSTSIQSSIEEFRKGYVVPYVMWANYDLEGEGKTLSANYLGGFLMEQAGLPMSGYQSWLSELWQDYPVLTANFYGKEETAGKLSFHEVDEIRSEGKIQDYAILQYNDLSDSKNRIENFFE